MAELIRLWSSKLELGIQFLARDTYFFFIFSFLLGSFSDFKSQKHILFPPEASESLGISTKEAVTKVYFSF